MSALNAGQQRSRGGNSVSLINHYAGQQTEDGHVESFRNREQKKNSPAAPAAHAAVIFQHELDPRTDAEPVDDSGELTQQKTPQRPMLARQSDEQRGKRQRSETGLP